MRLFFRRLWTFVQAVSRPAVSGAGVRGAQRAGQRRAGPNDQEGGQFAVPRQRECRFRAGVPESADTARPDHWLAQVQAPSSTLGWALIISTIPGTVVIRNLSSGI